MKLNLVPLFALSITGTLAWQASPLLVARDLVAVPCSEQGLKDCGTGCIGPTETCCPDGAGGCPVGKYCALGTNNKYGCCPNGKVCEGPGGAVTTRNVITETNTLTETQAQTTTQQVPPFPTATTFQIHPTGSAPSGTAPSGTAPSGTAPSGTAPSGTGRPSPSYTGGPFPPTAGASTGGFSAPMLGGLLAGVFILLL